jgi:integrase
MPRASYALRHACASLWIDSAYNPKQIQRLMAIARLRSRSTSTICFVDTESDPRAAQSPQAALLET